MNEKIDSKPQPRPHHVPGPHRGHGRSLRPVGVCVRGHGSANVAIGHKMESGAPGFPDIRPDTGLSPTRSNSNYSSQIRLRDPDWNLPSVLHAQCQQKQKQKQNKQLRLLDVGKIVEKTPLF